MSPRTSQPVEEDTLLKQKIVTAMHRRVIGDAAGTTILPFERYTGQPPDASFWLGTLISEATVETSDRPREAVERFKPASQGMSFLVRDFPVALEITVSFALWVALHPTFAEQRRRAGLRDDDREEEGDNGNTGGDPRVQIANVRMKVPVEDVTFSVTLDEADAGRIEPRHVGRQEITASIRQALGQLPDGTVLHRPLRRPGGTRPRASDVQDRGAWSAWEEENLGDEALPRWIAEVDVEIRDLRDGNYEVLVTMVNRSPDAEDQYIDEDRTRRFVSSACDPTLYETRMRVAPDKTVVPYELEQIPDSYRYDRTVGALGWNCAVARIDNGGFETTFAAVAETERVYPRKTALDGSTALDTRFRTLSDEDRALEAVDRLIEEAHAWVGQAWSTQAIVDLASRNDWTTSMRETARSDAAAAEQEVEWVRRGAERLESDSVLQQAFYLMNRVMERAARGRYDSWYPFQLAFILGCLPALVDPGTDDTVDILWFPTGGGKTESYLGLNVLFLFYERLQGRTGGTQTWARFPLRLLSLQQTQRFAESVLLAETVRRDQDGDNLQGRPFSVGYLVGSSNTPNRIELPDSRFYEGWDPFDQRNAESCRVLEKCPSCSERPAVDFDRNTHTMEHRCQTPGCPLEGRLPVYVIDDDIHRWTPSVVVGTVDKLTQISWSNGFRHLLGRSYGFCSRHGHSRRSDRCAVYPCDEPLRLVPEGFGGIRLEIQDEMHLLSESLGALDGNYETLFQEIASECGGPDIKIIGATATIEGYREQSDHLYRREPRRFPVPGPQKHESFWAFENPGDPLRTYVAALPRGHTMLNAAHAVTLSHRRFLEEALSEPGTFCREVLEVDEDRAGDARSHLRDLYDVVTTYALRKQELTRYQRDVMASSTICPTEAAWDQITGDVDFWDVREVLNRLENPEPDPERIRVLGATSAISHGVDINRLNVMCVMGMPNQTAEFIQATARVGRVHPGLVFCLINPMRQRDVSHFRYFTKWAEYLDRLVEHVPVNRESLPVLDVVLPGGFMAWLLQVDEPRWLTGANRNERRDRLWHVAGTARAIEQGELDETEMVERLLAAFGIDESLPRMARHRDMVENFVQETFLDLVTGTGRGESVPDLLERMGKSVPRSLRDVDTTILIRGDR